MNLMPTTPTSTISNDCSTPTAEHRSSTLRIRNAMRARRMHRSERGEGVISLAIAVLIMAVIGAAMYLVFSKLATDAGTKTTDKVATIN